MSLRLGDIGCWVVRARRDSNSQPSDPKSGALSIELRAHGHLGVDNHTGSALRRRNVTINPDQSGARRASNSLTSRLGAVAAHASVTSSSSTTGSTRASVTVTQPNLPT